MDVAIEDVSERHRRARAPGSAVARDPARRCRPPISATLKYFRLVAHDAPRHPGHDLAHRLHRRPRLRDLGRRRPRGRAVGRADRGGHAYGITPAGDLGARHRAHRGRPHHARRRLLLGAPRADRGAEVVALRDQPRLDGERRRKGRSTAGARSRAERARGPAWGFVGLEVDWVSLRAPVRGARPAAAAPERRLAHQRPGLPQRQPGRLRDERLLVAAAQEVRSRSRTCGRRTSSPDTPVADRGHGRAPARRADAVVRKLPFFDPERKKA